MWVEENVYAMYKAVPCWVDIVPKLQLIIKSNNKDNRFFYINVRYNFVPVSVDIDNDYELSIKARLILNRTKKYNE